MTISEQERNSVWCLEGFVDPDKRAWRTMIHALPISVGRRNDAEIQLLSDKVSNLHAEIFWAEGNLWLRDLGSTNGTFLNGEKISDPCRIDAGDTVRFADLEMRLTRYNAEEETSTTTLGETDLRNLLSQPPGEIERLLDEQAVRAIYQPVVRLDDLTVMGYEMLSRGAIDDFETGPIELFFLAEKLGREAELSQIFREQGVSSAQGLAGALRLFLNTHPAELQEPEELISSLVSLRKRWPDLRMVVEIHEAALTNPRTMREIRTILRDLEVELAFDDFGTGQSRLMVIGEVPPDFLKFDISFIKNLDSATESRQRLVRELVRLTRSMGILPVAEGVETEAEYHACCDVGFAWAQGFALGKFASPEELPLNGK